MDTYRLPLTLLLASVSTAPEPLFLRAPLPSIRKKIPTGCVAELLVKEGVLLSCVILRQPDHPFLQGASAIELLETLEPLDWVLVPRPGTSPTDLLQAISSTQEKMPKQQPIGPLFATLGHREVRVFNLANGTRTIEQIGLLSHLSVQEVKQILKALSERGWMTY